MASQLSDWMAFVVEQEKEVHDKIKGVEHCVLDCKSYEDKYAVVVGLYQLLEQGSAIVFCVTDEVAESLTKKLITNGYSRCVHIGEEGSHDEGKDVPYSNIKMFITTDRWAKGIDMKQAVLIVNYDLPVNDLNQADCEIYLHRMEFAAKKTKIVNLVYGFKQATIWKMIEDKLGMTFVVVKMDKLASLFESQLLAA